jgi:hypothetical protein
MAIQYRKEICTCHGENRYIVKRIGARKYCAVGNKKRLNEKKESKEGTGELDFFHKIWAERPHVCEISGRKINERPDLDMGRWVSCFSHILPKGSFGRYRLNPENIVLMLPELHHQWHSKGRIELISGKYGEKWAEVFEKKIELTLRYHTEKQL